MNNMEIKVGDKVRVSKDIPQFYRRYNSYSVFEAEHQVVDIEEGLALLDSIPIQYVTTIPTKYLIKVDAEAKGPTAPTIKVGDRVRCKNPIRLANSTDDVFIGTVTDAENGWFRVHMNNGAIFQTYHESDLELVQPTEQTGAEKNSFDWQRYEADLAKDIALKVANKFNAAHEAAEYAVSVAKAVAEGLKGM